VQGLVLWPTSYTYITLLYITDRLIGIDFYAAGFNALVKRWDKCVSVGGGYVEEKKCFFSQVLILHVLRFISICDLFIDSPL
jgi:hypothetical protein